MLGHMPDYIEDLLTPSARSSLRASCLGILYTPRTCQHIGHRLRKGQNSSYCDQHHSDKNL